MFKKIALALATVAALTGAVCAEPMVGKKMAAGSNGQPFCLEVENLKEFMIAAMTEDRDNLGAILKEGSCTMLKRGTSLAILEDLGDEDDELHSIKVRAISPKGSVVGYSLSVGMISRK